jgi:hypothetical protein
VIEQSPGLGALPSWLAAIGNKIIKGTTVTVPTPAGPVTVDLGDPASVNRAKTILSGTRISTSVASRPPSAPQQVDQFVQEQIPGGWLTIAGVGLGLLVFLPMLSGRRR